MLLRTSQVLLEILAVLLATMVLVLVGGAWRLSQGPVSLGFLKPYVATELAAIKGPVKVEIEDLILKWAGWQRALDIVAVNTSVRSRDGAVLASAPEIAVSFSVTSMLVGVIAPTSLELVRPQLNLVRDENRGFGVGTLFGSTDGQSDQFLPLVVDAMAARPDPNSHLSQLKKVSVIGAKITVDDPTIGAFWGARYADITISRVPAGVHIDYNMDTDFRGQNPTLRGTVDYRPDDGEIVISTDFEKLRPDVLSSEDEALAPLKGLGVTLRGSVKFRVSTDGKLKDAAYNISSGEGVVTLPHPHLKNIKVKSIVAVGRANAEQNRLVVERLAVDLGGPTINLSGSLTRHADHADFNAHAAVDGFPVNDFARYWAPDMASGGRKWIIENVRDGTLTNGKVDLSGRFETNGGEIKFSKFGATAQIRKTKVHFFRPMPPVRDADLSVTFGRDRIDVQVDGGTLHGITISEGSVALTELDEEDSNLKTDLVLRGGLSKALLLLNHPKLGYLTKLGIDPTVIKGETAIRVSARFPLLKDLSLKQIDIRAAANLMDVFVPKVAFGRDLTQGKIALRLDRDAMSLIGQAKIDGIPGEIAWYENFTDDAPFTRRYDMKTTLDDAARERFGVDPGKSLEGPVFADLSYVERTGKAPTLYAKLKLDDATISIPFLKWSKRSGKLGIAELEIVFQQKKMREIKGYRFAADGLLSSGSVKFSKDGSTFKTLNLSNLALGDRTNVGGTVTRTADGKFQVELTGTELDLTPYLNDESSEEGGSATAMLRAHGKVNKLWIGEDAAVANVEADVHHDGSSWRRISLNGDVIKGKRFSVNYGHDGKSGHLEVRAADAGNILKKLGLLSNLRDGIMTLSAARNASKPDEPWRGKLKISDFVLTKAPFMARLLTMASLTGISNVMAGKGVVFNRLDMPFTYASQRLEIKDARAVGSELGITGDGSIDLGKKKVDLDGTVVPAYTINSMLGNIPVLGAVFTGSKGGGIFAATYTMKGTFKKTVIDVNPLSVLAPGFLRDLIKGMGKAGTNKGPPPGTDIDPATSE
ncbi:MAG: AsmA-like C-terminal domain-containing protein [Rhodospirillales bacterium]|nr:AsmA-like C-terminal domain-containing protein [Rhodospirillales bacterium]